MLRHYSISGDSVVREVSLDKTLNPGDLSSFVLVNCVISQQYIYICIHAGPATYTGKAGTAPSLRDRSNLLFILGNMGKV